MSKIVEKLTRKDEKILSVSVKMNESVHSRLKEVAEEYDATLQQVIIIMLDAGLDAYQDEINPEVANGTGKARKANKFA